MNSVKNKYAIKDNFYHIKGINDILFNNQIIEDEEQFENDEDGDSKCVKEIKNWNIQKKTGKLLTAVFKDYLIFDDIFEFVQCYWPVEDSKKYIAKYAKY